MTASDFREDSVRLECDVQQTIPEGSEALQGIVINRTIRAGEVVGVVIKITIAEGNW